MIGEYPQQEFRRISGLESSGHNYVPAFRESGNGDNLNFESLTLRSLMMYVSMLNVLDHLHFFQEDVLCFDVV